MFCLPIPFLTLSAAVPHTLTDRTCLFSVLLAYRTDLFPGSGFQVLPLPQEIISRWTLIILRYGQQGFQHGNLAVSVEIVERIAGD